MFEITRHINGTTRYIRLFIVLLVGALVAGALLRIALARKPDRLQLARQAVHQ